MIIEQEVKVILQLEHQVTMKIYPECVVNKSRY